MYIYTCSHVLQFYMYIHVNVEHKLCVHALTVCFVHVVYTYTCMHIHVHTCTCSFTIYYLLYSLTEMYIQYLQNMNSNFVLICGVTTM